MVVMAGFWRMRMRGIQSYPIASSTRPRHRRKGLFRLAAGQAHELAREQGAISIPVEVICGDHEAIALYRGPGFQTIRTLDRYTCNFDRETAQQGASQSREGWTE